jgi:4-alpha-glucanotransferase
MTGQMCLSSSACEAVALRVCTTDCATMSAETFARSPRPVRKEHPEWWMDNRRKYLSMSLPIYALRDGRRPGIGKFPDLGRIYGDVLARQGIDTLVLLPPFQSTHISPYSPVSFYALNELYIDWSFVPEVCQKRRLMQLTRTTEDPRWIRYEDEFDRAEKLRLAAYREFMRSASAFYRARFQEFLGNQQRNRNWLNEYAWFMAERETNDSDGSLRRIAAESHMFAQWIAYNQFKDAIDEVHTAGGHVVIDIPLFRACNGVDTSRHSDYPAWRKAPRLAAGI